MNNFEYTINALESFPTLQFFVKKLRNARTNFDNTGS
jgi:hypothetical protein